MKLLNSIILTLALLVSMGWAADPSFCESYHCPYIDAYEVYYEFKYEFEKIQKGDKNCKINSFTAEWEKQMPKRVTKDDVVAQFTAMVTCDHYDSKKLPAYIIGAARFLMVPKDAGQRNRVMFYVKPITAGQLL